MDVLYGIPSSVRSPIGQIAEQSGGFRSLPFGDNGIGGEIRPQLVQYRNKMYTPDDFRAALFSDAADTMRATYLIDFNIEASVKKSDQEKIDVEVDLPASRDINPTLRFRKECRVKK